VLVAVGFAYFRWLELMRSLKQKGLVDLVYPEFFDNKDLLIAKRWSAYLRKLRRMECEVKVAVWPDYCYDERLKARFNVEWIFPLHRRDELSFALNAADYIGFPSSDGLRDYTLDWFSEQKRLHGFKAWLLGLKPRYIRKLHTFDACDITTVSLPGCRYPKWYEIPAEEWEGFVRRIKSVSPATLEAWW
jgi:hypothetical protein